ncbi:MAG: maltose ABC transporter substrate-binding protein [Anaerolineales bacterium]|nr:maltose ABC transporter substrate-binding protein [Anaerolineales bacterium]
MKKIWSILTFLLVVSLLLAACGPADTPTPEPTATQPVQPTETPEPTEPPPPTEEPLVELLVWADETRSPIIDELGNQFAADYGIKLVVQQLGFGDIRDQLAVAGPAGEGPDVIIGAHDWLGQLVMNGLVSPIDLGAKQNDFLEAALTAFVYEGELYGMPYATENIAFFCNPELVDPAPTTWAEVKALAEELEADSDGEVTAWTIQSNDPYHYFPLMNSFGGYVFGLTDEGYDPYDVGLDSEGAIAAAQWLQDMAESGHLQPEVDYDVMHALFTQGKVACIGTGPWALSMIRDSGIPYTINPFPAGDVGVGSPFLGVQGFMISAFSENRLLAETVFTEIFATEEFMQAMYDVDPRPPAFLMVRDAIDDVDLAQFAAAGEEGLPMPAIPEMSSVWEAWTNALLLVISQQQDAVGAFETAADQVRTAIE